MAGRGEGRSRPLRQQGKASAPGSAASQASPCLTPLAPPRRHPAPPFGLPRPVLRVRPTVQRYTPCRKPSRGIGLHVGSVPPAKSGDHGRCLVFKNECRIGESDQNGAWVARRPEFLAGNPSMRGGGPLWGWHPPATADRSRAATQPPSLCHRPPLPTPPTPHTQAGAGAPWSR